MSAAMEVVEEEKEPQKKIVFRLSKTMWRERSSMKQKELSEKKEKILEIEKVKSELRVSTEDSSSLTTSVEMSEPTPRRRSVSTKLTVFNPSACNKCSSNTPCNICLRKQQESDEEQRRSKSKVVPFEKNGDLQVYASSASVSSSSPTKGKTKALNKGKASSCDSKHTDKDKPPAKRGRKPSISEHVFSSVDALKNLENMKSSLPGNILDSQLQVAHHEIFQSAMNSVSHRNAFRHLSSLLVEHIQRLLRPALQGIMNHSRNGDIFNHPVDAVALGLREYFVKVTHPMDLGSVKSRLLQGYYHSIDACVEDITLVFQNAMIFNPVQHVVHQAAIFLNNIFQEDVKSVRERLLKEAERKRSHSCDLCRGIPCALCGEKCLKWEPPILVCHGPCGQRIKRMGIYFVSVDGSTLFCQKCHSTSGPVVSGSDTPSTTTLSSPGSTPVTLTTCGTPTTPSGSNGLHISPRGGNSTPKPLMKKDMLKRRFDEEVFEPWIDCRTCSRKVHQVCAIYNPFHKPNSGSAKQEESIQSIVNEAVVPDPSISLPEQSTKMVTRKRGRHKRVDEGRSQALSVSSTSDGYIDEDGCYTFQCAMCNLKAGASKSKRGKKVATPSGTNRKSFQVGMDGQNDEIKREVVKVEELQNREIEEMSTQASNDDHVSKKMKLSSTENDVYHDGINVAVKNLSGDTIVDEDIINDTQDSGTGRLTNVGTIESSHEEMEVDIGLVKMETNSTRHDANIGVNLSDGDADVSRIDVDEQLLSTNISCSKSSPVMPASNIQRWSAAAIPRTKLSDFIEAMVRDRLCRSTPSSSTGEAGKGVDNASVMDSITIRVVANASRSMDVPDIISDNLPTCEGNRVPPYFVYRQKCILLFQTIDGVDVCLFCLYVQEFDESCPEPNKSRVYIAYLDSVEYFRPRCLRTLVYHEIIIAYLKWAQVRGFKSGHIWACPPQRGDNFIFWCHPTQQRTPSRDRLNSWYNAMLSRAKSLGICSSVRNLWSSFFEGYGKREDGLQRQASKNSYVKKQHHSLKAAKQGRATTGGIATASADSASESGDQVPICPPVFEGDFWVNECARVFRSVLTRTQGVRYDKDKGLNQRRCREILKNLMTMPASYAFNQPVDHVKLNIPDYPLVVKKPMDFSTVRNKLRSNSYRSILDFAQDIRLTCANAMTYNPPTHVIHTLAKQLLEEFEKNISELVNERVGEIMASASDVNTWLATYPVNSAMEKEEKRKRLKEQQRQRIALASVPVPHIEAAVQGVGVGFTTDATNEVDKIMDVSESDQDILDSLVVGISNTSPIMSGAEPQRSTMCDTRRVFFSSPSLVSTREVGLPNDQRSDTDGSEYGFVDYESEDVGQSDVDSRDITMNNEETTGMRNASSPSPYENLPDLNNDSSLSRDMFQSESLFLDRNNLPGISRQDSVESVVSVAERWPRRPDRTSSMCVEESMESSGIGFDVGPIVQTPICRAELTIDINAIHSSSAINSVRRRNSLNTNLPFDRPQLGIKGAQALMSELSKNVCRLKDDMYVLTFSSPQEVKEVKQDGAIDVASLQISDTCARMLDGIQPDTTDPDPPLKSPFIESRQTFLEMCQFRHLQFDCLRRAKYSTCLLIFHLLFPSDEATRPHCHECKQRIKSVRWHCGSCQVYPDYDICNSCKYSKNRTPHVHEELLTPFRVTYV